MTSKLMTAKLITSLRAPVRILAVLLAGALAMPVLGASSAQADTGQTKTGKVHLTHDVTVSYRDLDFADPQDRLVLLTRVEKEARKFCDGYMVRADRRDCEEKLVINAMKTNPEAEQRALALALVERNTVAQAMR